MAVDRFLVVTPRRRTSSGSFGAAMATRFWTRTWARSGLVPSLNVTVSCMVPSLVHWDSMYSMPSTPLTSCSIGAATVSETVRASAPGYAAVTTTCGGTTSGYWAIGSWVRASRPARVMSTERTAAKTGRVMKNCMVVGPAGPMGPTGLLHGHRDPRADAEQVVHDDRIALVQAGRGGRGRAA